MATSNPFINTAADNDSPINTLTTQGGRCYDFDRAYNPNSFLHPDTIHENLYDFDCFNKPPIINNPVIDHPWPTPPPVTTGCYPLRARAQTLSDDDDPAGITATFVDNPSPGKCFPILDIKLNIKPIVTDVMGIIVPGGGGTINTSPSLGCCCTEYGGWASTGCSVYDGTIGQCIGRDFTGSECCAQYGSVGCAEGVGVRWVAGDTPCSMCDPNSGGSHQCCCDRARTRFESPQALGIGVITDGDEDDIGTWYTLDVYLAPGVGGYELSGRVQDVYCFNAAEDNMGGGGWGMCTDGRYQPGVAGSAVNPSYPASFKPQRVCPGTAVTVMGMTNAAFNGSGYGVMASRGAPPSDRTGTLGLYVGTCLGNGTVGSPNALATWFTTENAHDLTCT